MINSGIMSGLDAIIARRNERWEQQQQAIETGNYNALVIRYNQLVQRFDDLDSEAADAINECGCIYDELKEKYDALLLNRDDKVTTRDLYVNWVRELFIENGLLKDQIAALNKP